MASPKGIVTGSMVGTGIIVVVEKAQHGQFPGPKTLLGLAVLYIILGFIADFAPQLAAPLAVLVFLAVLLTNGGTALEGTVRALNRQSSVPNEPQRGRNLDGRRRDRMTDGRTA